jgi:hypothetical protein
MPHIWNEILVVTFEELVPEFYKTDDALRQAVCRANKKGYGIKKVQRGGNHHEKLIAYDSLPSDIKDQIKDPRKLEHILEKFYKTDATAVTFYQDFQFLNKDYLSEEHQSKYITNASMLQALILLKAAREYERMSKGYSTKGIMFTLCEDAKSFNPILQKKYDVMHTLPDSERRFKETFAKFVENGYRSLIHKNHGNKNPLKVTGDILKLLNDMFGDAVHKPNYTDVARQYDSFLDGYVEIIDNETGEVYNPKEYRKLNQDTIYNWLSDWKSKIGTHSKRSGDRQKLMQKFKPHHSMKIPEFAGSIISIDDRQPPFEYVKGTRMWWYMGIDLGSAAFTTWVYGTSKDGIIVDFYRQMVRNYHEWNINIPAELECESSLNSSFANTLLQEGRMFQHVRIEANNARGKRIERYFKDVRYGEEKQEEGWLGRPFVLAEANQKSSVPVPFKPYDEIVTMCLKHIETWNNMPHPVHTDKTRWEVFMEMQNPNTKPTNYRGILPYIGYVTKTSCNAGIIKLNKNEFLLGDKGEFCYGEDLIRLMEQVEGQNIDIYWLDGNNGKVIKALVYIGTQYICEALPKPVYARAKIEQTDNDLAQREIMSKYVASITGFQNKQMRSLGKLTIIDNTPKTLNNKFKIASLHETKEITNEPVEELAALPDDNSNDWNFIEVETSFKRNLKDRF